MKNREVAWVNPAGDRYTSRPVKSWVKIGLLVLLAGLAAVWLTPAPGPSEAIVGAAAPPLVLKDLAGRPVSLEGLRGRAVAVNFWATWCFPCREEMPALAEAWRASRGKCLEILGVAEESSSEDVAAESRRLGVPFPVVLDPDGAVARAFGVKGFPQTFLVDADGKVRRVFTGALTREKLEAAMAPLVPPSCPGS